MADEQLVDDAGEQLDDEPGGISDRTARAILGAAGLMAAWGVIAAAPEAAYFVAGLGASACCRKGRAWIDRRRATADEEEREEEPAPVDIGEHLRALGEGGHHVLLTGLRESTGLPDTKAVRALLEEAGIPVRDGVRAPAGNGPGVHMADIPGDPSPVLAAPSGRCLCSSGANANANNGTEGDHEKGLRVEPIGQAGTVVHDPAEAHRHFEIQGR
jgi:hypothetical protein